MINAKVDLIVVCIDEALALGTALGLVIDISMGWVCTGIEVEG